MLDRLFLKRFAENTEQQKQNYKPSECESRHESPVITVCNGSIFAIVVFVRGSTRKPRL